MATQRTIEVPTRDIPDALIESVREKLQHFFVPLIGVSPLGEERRVTFLGSGTLVRIGEAHCLLTAAHVWNEVRRYGRIMFGTSVRNIGAVMVPPAAIWCRERIYESTNGEEWGPDLALLQFAPTHAGALGARKSFLDLRQQQARLAQRPPRMKKGLWAVTGMVGELSHTTHDERTNTTTAYTNAQAFIGPSEETYDRDGYDYVDLGVNLKLPGVPQSFGGTSGGGLWQIEVSKKASGEIVWDGELDFRGVAFWQQRAARGRSRVRCHGPRSVFEMAWARE